jgi:hypothetical protein
MINVRQLLTGLTLLINRDDFPDVTSLAVELAVSVSEAQISRTKSGNMIIMGARLSDYGTPINVVCGIKPWREIWLLFTDPVVPYKDVQAEIYGANQRVVPSKFGAGFGVLFEIDGWNCGYTVSSPTGNIEALFCEAQRPSQQLRAS